MVGEKIGNTEAFDSTTFAAIQEALESRDVGGTVIRWIVNVLKWRNINLTYQGESVEAVVVKDCPQKGALSCLLWCKVIDSLLLKLNATGHTAQAYADYRVIAIQSKYLGTVTYLMQGSLRVVDGKTKGMSINPGETEVLLFARKRKTEGGVRLE